MNLLQMSFTGSIFIMLIFLDFKSKGKTIIIVSHNSEDINMLCDTVHEMDKGRLVE